MKRLCEVAVLICAGIVVAAEAQEFEPTKPAAEHQLLKRFVGEWGFESSAYMAPGEAPMKSTGTMTGHMIGDLWVIVVMKVDAEDQGFHGQATFGFDSMKTRKYVGTWADSMSAHLWRYEGTVDGNKLMMNTEGPHPADPDQMAKARDTWEFKGDDLILLTTQIEGPDGKMMTLMTGTCTRKK